MFINTWGGVEEEEDLEKEAEEVVLKNNKRNKAAILAVKLMEREEEVKGKYMMALQELWSRSIKAKKEVRYEHVVGRRMGILDRCRDDAKFRSGAVGIMEEEGTNGVRTTMEIVDPEGVILAKKVEEEVVEDEEGRGGKKSKKVVKWKQWIVNAYVPVGSSVS